MKLIIEESEKKMSESAMHILLGAMMQDKRVNISLTAGRSPKMLYQMMIPEVKDQDKFKNIHYYLCGRRLGTEKYAVYLMRFSIKLHGR